MTAIDRLLDRRMSPRRIGGAAHEVGHGLAYTAAGCRPVAVSIVLNWRGGYLYGHTQLTVTADEVQKWRREAYLVAVLAGHAAHARFCHRYLGMDPSEAWNYAWDAASDDHERYRMVCEQFGLTPHLHLTSARASLFIDRHARRLDRLTVALARHGRLSGGAF